MLLEHGPFDKTHSELVKNKCNFGELVAVLLERGPFDKTHPDLVKNKCKNFGENTLELEFAREKKKKLFQE